MDAITLTAAAAAGNHAISVLRGIVDTIKATGKSEVIDQLIDLQSALLEMVQKQTEIALEFQRLQNELGDARQRLTTHEALEFRDGMYFLKGGDRRQAFCPGCYDNNRKLVHAHISPDQGYWNCNVCGNVYDAYPN